MSGTVERRFSLDRPVTTSLEDTVRRLTAALAVLPLAAALALGTTSPAAADSGKPGQSMTHIKTAAGIAPTLEAAGVVLYTRGGATSAVMGDSIASSNGPVVFHVPVTSSASVIKHAGSVLVLFNTTNDQQVELRNPVIDLKAGVVRAGVGTSNATVFRIPNAKQIKPSTVVNDDGVRVTTYAGARLVLAPGVGATLASGLGLPAGSLPDGTLFATADVTLQGT